MMEKKTIDDYVLAVQKLLEGNGIYAEVYKSFYEKDVPEVRVEIDHGDWKHEHGRADYLVKNELGGIHIGNEVTWEDGSDCYSALHRYFFGFEVPYESCV